MSATTGMFVMHTYIPLVLLTCADKLPCTVSKVEGGRDGHRAHPFVVTQVQSKTTVYQQPLAGQLVPGRHAYRERLII